MNETPETHGTRIWNEVADLKVFTPAALRMFSSGPGGFLWRCADAWEADIARLKEAIRQTAFRGDVVTDILWSWTCEGCDASILAAIEDDGPSLIEHMPHCVVSAALLEAQHE